MTWIAVTLKLHVETGTVRTRLAVSKKRKRKMCVRPELKRVAALLNDNVL